MLHPKQILERHGLYPKKSLGQNFLHDKNILAQIADAANLSPDDNVLEIGAGLGSLTHFLALAAGRVVSVELDERLLPILRANLAVHQNVSLVHGDILEQDPAHWFGEAPYKVAANLPYYITGALLRHLLMTTRKPALLVLMVQKEVAERIAAPAGNMSLLAVSVQFYGRPAIVMNLKAGAFWPRPEVDSAVIRLEIDPANSPSAQVEDEKLFFRLARAGFSQKRKQLQKNLRSVIHPRSQIERILEEAQIDGRRRAETLSLAEWVRLYQVYSEGRLRENVN